MLRLKLMQAVEVRIITFAIVWAHTLTLSQSKISRQSFPDGAFVDHVTKWAP